MRGAGLKTGPVVIKKYGNRRLYDTSTSRYINLDDIARLVRNGKNVQVLDARSGEDLTRVTLAQIIMEDAKEQPTGLPLELLRQLIVATDEVGRDFVMWYLRSAFDTYQKLHSALQSGITGVRSAALTPLEVMQDMLKGSRAEKERRPAAPRRKTKSPLRQTPAARRRKR
ncbi:MAG TPA: polyhydroxyalkanoate synthesis regulator DNA-binding domain-containing protein [Terriglobales bacterium]|nr:polyhydroxyalkanoate synthesis regulator DNA-binding domain-containing protein [Terriglobales bacterium]